MGKRRGAVARAVTKAFTWVRRQPRKVQILVMLAFTVVALLAVKLLVREPIIIYFAATCVHCLGILVLIYKLTKHNSCSGLSLKTQELTAIFSVARLGCSYWLDHNTYTLLYFVTLGSTLWVIYMMRFKLKSTYFKELDIVPLHYVIVPCAILGILIHPNFEIHGRLIYMIWAFSLYLESISVFPQLRMMQNTKMIEPFTAHYVFALGVSRFLTFANWIIQVTESAEEYWTMVGDGYLWLPAFIAAELVQTFILADFCYYYIKSVMNGQLIVRISSPA